MGVIFKFQKPDMEGTIPLEKTIAQRRSKRQFLPDAIEMEDIGQLCWAAQGEAFTATLGRAEKMRTTPSAGALYPLEVFIISADGAYSYLPKEHSIEQLSEGNLRGKLSKAAFGQEFIKHAPVIFILAGDFVRTMDRYGERGIRYSYIEAGHAAQNIHLEAEALGLGSVAIGAFEDEEVSKILNLPENIKPLYMVAVGHYRK